MDKQTVALAMGRALHDYDRLQRGGGGGEEEEEEEEKGGGHSHPHKN